MKTAMKLLTVLMTAVLALSIAGCASARTGNSRKSSPGNKIDIKELQKNTGNMAKAALPANSCEYSFAPHYLVPLSMHSASYVGLWRI